MKITSQVALLSTVVGLWCCTAGSLKAQAPLVYDVENTGSACAMPILPSVNQLPSVARLPDPFEWSDGSGRITSFDQWTCRRAEIKAEIEHYEIGPKPDRPNDITASYSGGTLTVNVTENGQTLTLTSTVNLPSGAGPFPVVIGMAGQTGGATGSLPASLFEDRNVASIAFNHDQVMQHTQVRGSEPYNRLYPDLEYAGSYSAWSWGVSRIIDGLELVSNQLPIALEKIAVTGCSYAGKMALFAGAFDERIALTIAQESGGGGVNSWRVSETIGNVEKIDNTNYAWFMQRMKDNFQGQTDKLPHDHHELMAMIAPRALIVLGNPPFEWLGDESGYVASRAAQEVWDAMGISDRFGFSFTSGHDHCQLPSSSYSEVGAFIDKFLLDDVSANTDVAVHSFGSTDYNYWIDDWKGHTLTFASPESPVVSLSTPLPGSSIEIGESVVVNFTVDDPQNDVANTSLYINQELIEIGTASLTAFEWTATEAGHFTVEVQATDDQGNVGKSNSVLVQVIQPRTGYNGVSHVIPGVIQAEEYDLGGEGVAFHEADDNGNEGGADFRLDPVDIELTGDLTGDYNVGYILTGEWLEYTIDVVASGDYIPYLRVATNGTGKSLHLEVDGIDASGSIEVPDTEGWQNWVTITADQLHLTAGKHILRLAFDADYMNINFLQFESALITGSSGLAGLQVFQWSVDAWNRQINLLGLEHPVDYKVFNLQGGVVQEGSSATKVSTEGWSNGTYLLVVNQYVCKMTLLDR